MVAYGRVFSYNAKTYLEIVMRGFCPKFHKIKNQLNSLKFEKSKQLYHAQKSDV